MAKKLSLQEEAHRFSAIVKQHADKSVGACRKAGTHYTELGSVDVYEGRLMFSGRCSTCHCTYRRRPTSEEREAYYSLFGKRLR